MCSVIGYWPLIPDPDPEAKAAFARLFYEGSIRGLHAFGIASLEEGSIHSRKSHKQDKIPEVFNPRFPTIAHTRYSLSGDWHEIENNQPIHISDYALAFNGVISMKTKEEMEAEFGMTLAADNDGEVFLQSIARGEDPATFLARIPGSFAGVWLDSKGLYAGRNARRPLWKCEAHGAIWYASTRDIFARAGFVGQEEVALKSSLAVIEVWQ